MAISHINSRMPCHQLVGRNATENGVHEATMSR
jgi:hypothetical protein